MAWALGIGVLAAAAGVDAFGDASPQRLLSLGAVIAGLIGLKLIQD